MKNFGWKQVCVWSEILSKCLMGSVVWRCKASLPPFLPYSLLYEHLVTRTGVWEVLGKMCSGEGPSRGKMAEALQWCASVGLSYLIWGAIGLWIPTPLQPIFLSTCSMGYDRREAMPGATHCLHGAHPFSWCSLCLPGAVGQGLKVLAETPFLHILSGFCVYADPGDSIAPTLGLLTWSREHLSSASTLPPPGASVQAAYRL